MASSYQDRINARRGTGVNKKNKKVKPVSKDPRPKQSDIRKKYKNYGDFRQAVKAWRVRNGFAKAPKPKEKKKYVSPRERKFGKSKLKINKEIDKSVDTYVKKMKGDKPIRKVDYPSKSENKSEKVVVEKNKEIKKDNQNKGPNLEAANEILSGKKKEVTMDDFKGDGKESKDKKNDKLKIKRYKGAPKGYIKTGGKFASLKSVKGKRAAMRADRLKALQDKIKANKKKKKK